MLHSVDNSFGHGLQAQSALQWPFIDPGSWSHRGPREDTHPETPFWTVTKRNKWPVAPPIRREVMIRLCWFRLHIHVFQISPWIKECKVHVNLLHSPQFREYSLKHSGQGKPATKALLSANQEFTDFSMTCLFYFQIVFYPLYPCLVG